MIYTIWSMASPPFPRAQDAGLLVECCKSFASGEDVHGDQHDGLCRVGSQQPGGHRSCEIGAMAIQSHAVLQSAIERPEQISRNPGLAGLFTSHSVLRRRTIRRLATLARHEFSRDRAAPTESGVDPAEGGLLLIGPSRKDTFASYHVDLFDFRSFLSTLRTYLRVRVSPFRSSTPSLLLAVLLPAASRSCLSEVCRPRRLYRTRESVATPSVHQLLRACTEYGSMWVLLY